MQIAFANYLAVHYGIKNDKKLRPPDVVSENVGSIKILLCDVGNALMECIPVIPY